MPLIAGEKQGCFALTEPDAGTDAASQKTVVVLNGDHYILNGTKCFITNGSKADFAIVMAMTDRSKGVKGISAFIVEKAYPGFSVGKHENKMGIRGTNTVELIKDYHLQCKQQWQSYMLLKQLFLLLTGLYSYMVDMDI